MKQKWLDAYMDTAKRFSELSSATRLKVGACVVKDHRIISIGYNGTPSGWDNECEVDGTTKDEVVHAEANAIIKLARDGESGKDASIFITHAPCIHCSKMIQGAGIKNVYYSIEYRDDSGVKFLEKSGLKVEKIA
jgi:dCMP deaminase